MHSLLLVIFFISLFLVLHTYLFYPLAMMLLAQKADVPVNEFANNENELPLVALLIAAYNEEKVIGEKIRSVFNSGYPRSKIKVYVGSDASTDRTDEIVLDLRKNYPAIELIRFKGRVGKIGIINHLQSLAKEGLLVLTDANVLFAPDTLFELIKKFRDERVGIVAANIVKQSLNNEGISLQEKKYLSLENKIKTGESRVFRFIMGAEGGCYVLRSSCFRTVPANFIVDDFFITLSVLNQGKLVLFSPSAICFEDVSSDESGEYRRKVRISSGNFQNLFFFWKNLLQFWKPVCFAFWSHKVLRWLTPFLLIICLLSSALLMRFHPFFAGLFALQVLGFLMPAVQSLFHFRSNALKFISHFYLMNFALLAGFIKFAGGIKTSIWQPVNRNV